MAGGSDVDVESDSKLVTAAMEPRPDGRGKTAGAGASGAGWAAAMEPRPDGRGKTMRAPNDVLALIGAAMEPRPDGRGKTTSS